MKYIIYPHNGCGDHGSEARLRALLNLMSGVQAEVFSDAPEEDLRYWPQPLFSIRRSPAGPAFFQKTPGIRDIMLSFQGDHPLLFPQIPYRGPQVLLGASIPARMQPGDCLKLFAPYDLLFAYDKPSWNILTRIHANAVYCPDPLFASLPQAFLMPGALLRRDFIVFSINPEQTSQSSQLLFDSSVQLIRHLMDTTDFQIALTPFVCQPGRDDRTVLSSLYQIFSRSGRVVLLPELSSRKVHYLLTKARYAVTSYPAEAILSYAALTPVLLLHDSSRALGIARDLLGERRYHVLAPEEITDTHTLIRALHALSADETRILRQLKATLPACQEQLTYFRQALRGLGSAVS